MHNEIRNLQNYESTIHVTLSSLLTRETRHQIGMALGGNPLQLQCDSSTSCDVKF